MSVWCSTIWMEKAIDIIFLLLIHANGTVCSRCWEKKLQFFKDLINLGNNSRLSSVLCPTQRNPHKPSINIFLSLFMRSERGCNVTTGCTSCSLRVFTPFTVFWSLLITDFSGSRFNVYFIFGGLHLVYDSNKTHKFLMASCIYAGCAWRWQSVVHLVHLWSQLFDVDLCLKQVFHSLLPLGQV